MLKRLTAHNLTVFPNAEFNFSSGLNVVVGENGTGKTHILKAAYTGLYVSSRGRKDPENNSPTKSHLQLAMASKLLSVFKPDGLGRLARRQQGQSRCEIEFAFNQNANDFSFSFHTASKSEVVFSTTPTAWIEKPPVFLPSRELLTIYPGFISLYETTHLPFDETWRDLCVLLGAPLARGPREKQIKQLLAPLENAMEGSIELVSDRFYLNTKSGKMEMHLVAEGFRKLAMVARLIATGSLTDKGYFFWDEPEANLNPRIIKIVARTIIELCSNGIQVFIATHSLFLLREVDILLQSGDFNEVEASFFGLHRDENGVSVLQGKSIDDIGDITALDEELNQSDRYLASEAGNAGDS